MVRNAISGRTAAAIAASVEEALHVTPQPAGYVLPTVRSLAASLKVSPATVAAAYRILRSRGLVSGNGRRGTRVALHAPIPGVSTRVAPPGASDLGSGNPDPALLPALDGAFRTISHELRLYGQPPTLPELRRFACGEFEADAIPAAAVTAVAGGLDGIDLVLREHLRPGDRVGVEDPIFPGILDLLSAARLVPEPFAIDDDGPLPNALQEVLKRRCRAIVVTPRAQNPTGAALTENRVADLKRVLRRYPDVLVVEDDYAGPVAGAAARTLVASRRHWAVVRSTAKFLGPDLRVAVMAGDPLTIARVEGRQSIGMRWVSYILQRLALALWSDPSSGRLLAHAANVYEHRRTALLAALGTRGISAHGRTGFNIWIPVNEETRTVHDLVQRGWSVTPGERFRLNSPPGIRVTTAALAPPQAESFADSLAEVLRRASTGLA
jgi:DNA-binding transcriptional MocR family regulator